ncbi:MAG: Fur family transcriptional regulator [Acidimicrobiia bacterium]|nr:Fur family transcriptional regulator [Acidimicrobiia bacterium]
MGLKATRARIAVVSALQDSGGHQTADEVSRVLAGRGTVVSRATVFNALDDLTRAGLVMVADAGPGATRYESADVWHHHFVCISCGAISDVACRDDSPRCVDTTGVEGQVDEVQVIFRGTCSACLELDS